MRIVDATPPFFSSFTNLFSRNALQERNSRFVVHNAFHADLRGDLCSLSFCLSFFFNKTQVAIMVAATMACFCSCLIVVSRMLIVSRDHVRDPRREGASEAEITSHTGMLQAPSQTSFFFPFFSYIHLQKLWSFCLKTFLILRMPSVLFVWVITRLEINSDDYSVAINSTWNALMSGSSVTKHVHSV